MNPWARPAITVIALLVIMALLAVTLVDATLELRGRRAIGQRINRWARRNVVLSTTLVALLGALLAHFFWQRPAP